MGREAFFRAPPRSRRSAARAEVTGGVSVVLVAAGRGRRFGAPKQFEQLLGRPLLYWPLHTFEKTPGVREIVLVVAKDRLVWARRFVGRAGLKKVRTILVGGRERADSVRAGLGAVSSEAGVVLIHDAARVLVSRELVERVAAAAQRTGAALAARPVPDTVKAVVRKPGRFFVKGTVPRAGLWLAQTPQGFRADVARRIASRLTPSLTDDVQAAERLGIPVEIVPGAVVNFKVTVPEDLDLARAILLQRVKRGGMA
ncbi:MAG: 2-C-methyl-D-erythritol 4-phosphate cytidylyltransferase [Elusimicrobia bacterium]|nr:2-C-methyl-D-erythritol 4-phosphate cytidylyltransferase [Elusimicrobiota bacterium]